MKIKKNDKVKIMRGKDKGKEGKVLQVFIDGQKIVVEGMNLHFRHLRPRKANEKGQRVEFPSPMSVSNVMLIDPKTGNATRTGYKEFDGQKQRISKKSGEKL